MKMIARQTFKRVQAVALALVFGLSIVASASARSSNATQFPNIRIKNFGQMDDRFFRGGQPKESDYKALADLGIKTIIDLRDDPTRYEKRIAESLGMRYVNIPMSDSRYPSDAQIDEFLKLVADPATGKFFVHCAGGRHRTGVMGAVYRYNFYGWDYDRVYKEMKDYDFYTRWGHGAMKDYVQDYYQRIQAGQIHTQVSAAAGASR
ncbi:MAG TPA: tyrosine-protein phosphatase [Blastocatellia bacterium]|nr:tyrosine-protein phosphatase [Blastocatellia bacterium]